MDDMDFENGFPETSFYITLFDILQGLLFSLLLLVFLTAQFTSTVKRTKTWFIFIGSIVEWCAAYLLLLGHQTGDGPPVGLCAFQAAVVYSSTAFAPSAALAFELELFVNLQALVNQTGALSRKGAWGLVLFPVLVYFIMFIWVITFGLSQPNLLERSAQMFCHMRAPTSSEESPLARPPVVSAVVAMLVGILIVIFSVWNNVIIVKYKRKMRASQNTSIGMSILSTSELIRRNAFVTALTVLGIIMAITSLSQLSPNANPPWNLALSGVPIATFFLFGTHMDLIRVWFCLSASPNDTLARLPPPREQPILHLGRIRSNSIPAAGQSH